MPRTARENQQLYTTLLTYWNATAHDFYLSIITRRKLQQSTLEPTFRDPFRALLDPEAPRRSVLRMKRHADGHHWDDDDDDDDDDNNNDHENEDDQSSQRPSGRRTEQRESNPNARGSSTSMPKGKISEGAVGVKLGNTDVPGGDIVGGGMIWIDISSWQTAGCWVPGGVHGVCPYQAADNTVALQEIIKVSSIGECLKRILQ